MADSCANYRVIPVGTATFLWWFGLFMQQRCVHVFQLVRSHCKTVTPVFDPEISHYMTKPTKWVCAQRRLRSAVGILPDWSKSSLCTQWVAKDPSFLHADSEDSDQTGRMPRLIWVFAGRTVTLLDLSCRGWNVFDIGISEHEFYGDLGYKSSFLRVLWGLRL